MHLTHRRIGGSHTDLRCGTALLLTPLVSKEPEGTLFIRGDGEQVERPECGCWRRLVRRLTYNFSNDSPVCLSRLSGGAHEVTDHCDLSIGDGVIGGLLSQEQLIALARYHGFEPKLARLGWQELRALLMAGPVLLILRNGNVVIAAENHPDSTAEEVIGCDPLYREGERFFLTRNRLETAWDGLALALNRPPAGSRAAMAHFSSTVRICFSVAIACLALYPRQASNETAASNLQRGAPLAATVASDEGLSSSFGRSAIKAVTAVRLQPDPGLGEREKSLDPDSATADLTVSTNKLATATTEQESVPSDGPYEPTAYHFIALPKQSRPGSEALEPVRPVSDTQTARHVTVLRGASLRR